MNAITRAMEDTHDYNGKRTTFRSSSRISTSNSSNGSNGSMLRPYETWVLHEQNGSTTSDTSSSQPTPQLLTLDQILEELDLWSGGPNALQNQTCPSNRFFFYTNRILRTNTTTNTTTKDGGSPSPPPPPPRAIPRILHLTYPTRCVNQDIDEILRRWHTQLPFHSVIFVDDDALDRFLYDNDWPEFPNLHDALECIPYGGAMLTDVWRALTLWK